MGYYIQKRARRREIVKAEKGTAPKLSEKCTATSCRNKGKNDCNAASGHVEAKDIRVGIQRKS